MKKVTEEKMIKQEVVTWVAIDGTVFKSEEECKKYEDSAQCAIESAFKGITKKEVGGDSLNDVVGGVSYDDNLIAVKIETAEDLKVVNMWLKQYGASSIGAKAIGTVQLMCKYYSDVYVYGDVETWKQKIIDFIDKNLCFVDKGGDAE